jgi:isohexenylglutaconyl-CoA hydratase
MSIELAEFTTLALRRDGPRGGVLHVTLNRPAQRNAMSLAMVRELRAVLAQAELKGDFRVIVLRGAGGHFCAGADVADLAAARARLAENPRAIEETNAAFGALCGAWAATGIATVAVVEGACMGGGFGLACVADVTLAAPGASFRLPETRLGLVPAQIAPFLVERLGVAEARRLAVTGATLDAATAHTLRLAHGVGDVDALLAATLSDILACAPGAIAATKALMAKARLQTPATLVAEAAALFSRAALGPEGQEGTLAFLGKRKPSWAAET